MHTHRIFTEWDKNLPPNIQNFFSFKIIFFRKMYINIRRKLMQFTRSIYEIDI